MRHTALAHLAILTTLSCTACNVVGSAEGEVDETRAAFEHVVYIPPPGVAETMAPPTRLAITSDGTYTIDGEPASATMLGDRLAAEGKPSPYVELVIPETFTVEEALPIFRLLEQYGHQGAHIESIDRFGNFESGVESGEILPGDAFFRGTVNEYEFPAFVSYKPDTDTCRTTFNGSAVSSEQLYERAFEKLDMIVMREGGPEAVVSNPEIMEALVATVQSPPDTPWRCVAGVTFHLIASGWPAIRYELVVDD